MSAKKFVVMKFGGSSVATREGWQTIRTQIETCIRDGLRPVVVHSAIAGASDDLEALLDLACRNHYHDLRASIRENHVRFATSLDLDGESLLHDIFDELDRISDGISLTGEKSPRLHARVVACGELMAGRLGTAFLRAQGVDIAAVDARELLVSKDRPDDNETNRFTSATCDYQADFDLQQRLAGTGIAIVTHGFIARSPAGDTVLLGRGGSDTSAACLAAKLEAQRLEIWTDVPGMYTADPRIVPGARLLKKLDYAEAQEIATTGAKVLHPGCLRPVQDHNIPLLVRSTRDPAASGTLVSNDPGSVAPRLKAISSRRGLTLVSMESAGMWRQAGFLANAFGVFARYGVSIDLVSTSETSVTVSLDSSQESSHDDSLARVIHELEPFCRVTVLESCAAISLVGRQIRAILHELTPAFEIFKEYQIFLVTQAANDLNFTFVVDEQFCDRLVQRLHDLLIKPGRDDLVFGPAWAETQALRTPAKSEAPWWANKLQALIKLTPDHAPIFAYDGETLSGAACRLQALKSIERVFYSIKANPHAGVLKIFEGCGLGFECVSAYELRHVLKALPGIAPTRILFTPNFAARREYEEALAQNVLVTLDNGYPLAHWPEVFRGREVILRIDPGHGKGHHRHVQTAGKNSKFGVPAHDLQRFVELAAECDVRIVGLHAHKGSGIADATTWRQTADTLLEISADLPDVRILNLGGGLGVPDTSTDAPLDLAALDAALAPLKEEHSKMEFWLEPGRFLVAQAGVLLSRVTQLKGKDGVRYVGLNAGMNSLIRPALYGAFHEIVNLSRYTSPSSELVDIVGPICESADILGSGRMLPPTHEGDVILIANAGAYGRVMSSTYNLRPPGQEHLINGDIP